MNFQMIGNSGKSREKYMKVESKWDKRRKRLFHIIEVGSDFDTHSRFYDYENAIAIFLNLTVTILYTFEEVRVPYGHYART